MMEMFCNQRVVTVAQPCEYTKNHWIIHSIWWILWYINYLNTTVIFLSEIMNNSQLIYLRRCFKDQIEVTIGVHVLNLKAVFIIHFPSLVSTTFNTLLSIYELHMWYFFCLFTFPSLTTWVNAETPSPTMVRTEQQGFWHQVLVSVLPTTFYGCLGKLFLEKMATNSISERVTNT